MAGEGELQEKGRRRRGGREQEGTRVKAKGDLDAQEATGFGSFSGRCENSGRVGWQHFTRGVKRPYLDFNKIILTGLWRNESKNREIKETFIIITSRNCVCCLFVSI